MSGSAASDRPLRVRREPPPFRMARVVGTERPTPHVVRVVFDGPDLHKLVVDEPAASVRLLLPSRGTSDLEVPTWNGNEFLLANGERPIIRTFTPIRLPAMMLDQNLPNPFNPMTEISFEIATNGAGHDEAARPRVVIYGTLDGTDDIRDDLPLVEQDGLS